MRRLVGSLVGFAAAYGLHLFMASRGVSTWIDLPVTVVVGVVLMAVIGGGKKTA